MKHILTIDCFKHYISMMEFSQDGSFLAIVGCDHTDRELFQIWQMSDLTVVYSLISERPYTQSSFCLSLWVSNDGFALEVCWGAIRPNGKFRNFELVTTTESQVYLNTLEFNLGTMKYIMKNTAFQKPAVGLNRNYTCSVIDTNTEYLFLGTKSGELCVFLIKSLIFKASIQLGNCSITCIEKLTDGSILCGFHDGSIRRIQGSDTRWACVLECRVPSGSISNIAHFEGRPEVFAATDDAAVYRINAANMNFATYFESHKGPIVSMAFKAPINRLATIDRLGFAKVWIPNKMVIQRTFCPNAAKIIPGRSIAFTEENQVLTGWDDSVVRCYSMDSPRPIWEIVSAHKGGVSAVYSVVPLWKQFS